MAEFKKGDRVQVKSQYDEALLLLGVRTPPGTVDHVYGEEGHVVVALDDEHGNEAQGQALPYPSHELAHVAN